MRMKALNTFVLANVAHRPVRTILSILAIAVEVTMILTLVGVSHGTLDATARRARGVGADIMIRPPGSSILGLSTAPMSEKLIPFLQKQPHVVLALGTGVQPLEGFDTITGLDLDAFTKMSGGFHYLAGGPFKSDDDILVDEYYAREKHLHVGDPLQLINHTWHLAGIFEGGKLTRIAIKHRTQILYALIAPDMPEDVLTYSRSWERAAWIIRDYGILLPYATMNDPDDRNMVVRIAADLLRYCAHKKNPFETVMREAEALYKFNPLDLIPYVLAEDPKEIAGFQNKFSMTQGPAVDMIIEFTDYGDSQALRQFYGRKGPPSQRIRHLRHALRESEKNSASFLSWYGQRAKAKAVDKSRRPRTAKKQP